MKNLRFGTWLLFLLALSFAARVAAQGSEGFPAKPIHIIVPYGAGGSTDVIARIVAQKLGERLGKAVVVEDRPGANGIIGSEVVAKAEPDGYTLLACSNGQTVNVTLYKSLPFDLTRDFVSVAGIASMPNVVAVHPSQPIPTFAALIAAAKADPTRLAYGHAGVGSSQNLSGELLKLRAGINMRQIAYKGGGPAVADALGDHVPVVIAGLPAIVQYVKSGQLRALAVTSARRSSQLPDVPTVAEEGYPGFNQVFWIGLIAPRGVPAEVVTRLNSAVNEVLATPEVVKLLAAQGAEPMAGSPAQLAKFMQQEIATAADVIKQAHIELHR